MNELDNEVVLVVVAELDDVRSRVHDRVEDRSLEGESVLVVSRDVESVSVFDSLIGVV